MLLNKVVAKFKDGTVLRGNTNDFFPNKKLFHLELIGSDAAEVKTEKLKAKGIDTESLKAAFFVKGFKGNKFHKNIYNDNVPGSGKKIEVKFIDGEVIIGYSLNYSPDRNGFFVIPADLKGNNERIFVIRSATEKVTLLSPVMSKAM
jgi:hypothetical protein